MFCHDPEVMGSNCGRRLNLGCIYIVLPESDLIQTYTNKTQKSTSSHRLRSHTKWSEPEPWKWSTNRGRSHFKGFCWFTILQKTNYGFVWHVRYALLRLYSEIKGMQLFGIFVHYVDQTAVPVIQYTVSLKATTSLGWLLLLVHWEGFTLPKKVGDITNGNISLYIRCS